MRVKVAVLTVAAVGCWAGLAAGPKPVAQVKPAVPAEKTRSMARDEFHREWIPAFAGRKVLPAELAEKGLSDFTANDVVWTIALPVGDDRRLRFIKATFKNGAFVSGTLHLMGLPAASLTPRDFALLRRRFVMLAVCDRPDAPACLFRPMGKPMVKPVPKRQALGLGVAPLDEIYGDPFLSEFGSLAVKNRDKLHCRVGFIGPEGRKFPLGEVQSSRGHERLDEKTICAALAVACPELVSERDTVEYYLKGSLTYELVLPEETKEVK